MLLELEFALSEFFRLPRCMLPLLNYSPCLDFQMGPKAETKAAKPKAAAAKPAAKKQTQARLVKKTIGGDKNGGHRLVRKTRMVRYFNSNMIYEILHKSVVSD